MLDTMFKDKKELLFRTLSLLLSTIFFANIPSLLFLIYMGHHSFFSYDFFSEGVFGLNVFFGLTSIFVIISSMSLFWWILPLVERWKKGVFKLWSFLGIVLVNALFLSLVVITYPKDGDYFRLAYVLSLGLFVTFHISFLCYAKPSEQIRTLTAVIFVITFMSLHLREQASSLLAMGLKAYSMGGEIKVELKPKFDQERTLSGELLLMSPKHIYIKLDQSKEGSVSVIDRSKFDVISSVRNSNKELKNEN